MLRSRKQKGASPLSSQDCHGYLMVHMIHKYTLLPYKAVFAFQRNAHFSKFSSKNVCFNRENEIKV